MLYNLYFIYQIDDLETHAGPIHLDGAAASPHLFISWREPDHLQTSQQSKFEKYSSKYKDVSHVGECDWSLFQEQLCPRSELHFPNIFRNRGNGSSCNWWHLAGVQASTFNCKKWLLPHSMEKWKYFSHSNCSLLMGYSFRQNQTCLNSKW
jgi:hypothetical protein